MVRIMIIPSWIQLRKDQGRDGRTFQVTDPHQSQVAEKSCHRFDREPHQVLAQYELSFHPPQPN